MGENDEKKVGDNVRKGESYQDSRRTNEGWKMKMWKTQMRDLKDRLNRERNWERRI